MQDYIIRHFVFTLSLNITFYPSASKFPAPPLASSRLTFLSPFFFFDSLNHLVGEPSKSIYCIMTNNQDHSQKYLHCLKNYSSNESLNWRFFGLYKKSKEKRKHKYSGWLPIACLAL